LTGQPLAAIILTACRKLKATFEIYNNNRLCMIDAIVLHPAALDIYKQWMMTEHLNICWIAG